MKKYTLILSCCLVMGFVSYSSAALIGTIPGPIPVDPLLAVAQLQGKQTAEQELTFINNMLELEWTKQTVDNVKDELPDWLQVTPNGIDTGVDPDGSDLYAYELPYYVDYALVKLGNGQTTPYNTFLFDNRSSNDLWLTILVGGTYNEDGSEILNYNTGNLLTTVSLDINDIGAISHVVPIPEPATMLLFGTGLAGLAGVVARRKKR